MNKIDFKENLILIGYILLAGLGMISFVVLVIVILIVIFIGFDYIFPQELGFWPIDL